MAPDLRDARVETDQRVLKAIGHPLRQRILRLLNERVASPSEISKALDESLPNVSYHVKILLECKAIELVRTRPVRGALEHFYRPLIRPHIDNDTWASLPKSTRDALWSQCISDIGKHIGQAAASGGLDDPLTRISTTPLELDDRAYRELVVTLDDLLLKAMDLQAESIGRREPSLTSGRGDHRTEMAIMHFHRAGENSQPS